MKHQFLSFVRRFEKTADRVFFLCLMNARNAFLASRCCVIAVTVDMLNMRIARVGHVSQGGSVAMVIAHQTYSLACEMHDPTGAVSFPHWLTRDRFLG